MSFKLRAASQAYYRLRCPVSQVWRGARIRPKRAMVAAHGGSRNAPDSGRRSHQCRAVRDKRANWMVAVVP